ncbi:hypothetical protein [Georgenia sp. SUBG003]|uniref:hypothetical protein n=1 Tax=Georgenia sp. SUBG003 TaxID=1497974 RepID=UPI00069405DD
MEQARADEAGRRRDQAAERLRELAALRSRLAAGDAVTREDLERALERAEESRVLADEAHEHAAQAHHRAALAHLAAAELLDVLDVGRAGDAGGAVRAAAHRAAARADFSSEQEDIDEARQHDARGPTRRAAEGTPGTMGRETTDEQGARRGQT